MLKHATRLLLALVVSLSGLALLDAAPAHADRVSMRVRAAIRILPVAYEHPAGYSRTKFQHWIDADRDCRNTRDEVLAAESRVRTTGRCRIETGRWVSPWDRRVRRTASSLVVDHLVPIAEAWRSGARRWSAATRRSYANDLSARSLVAVTGAVRRAKADKDPAHWMPRYNRCTYIRQWVAVKLRWRLAVNPIERRQLIRWGNRCSNPVLTVHRPRIVLAGQTTEGTATPDTGTQEGVKDETAEPATGPDLYVYGHSWTTGYGLPDPAARYTRQVAEALGLRFTDDVTHSRGTNGALAHQVLNRLYGGTTESAARWATGTDGVVLIEALLNSLRDQGAEPDALETSRQSLRTMLATLNAAERIEQDDPRITLSGTWATSAANQTGSGGTWTSTATDGDYAEWTATGGEYVALRGYQDAGATATLRDVATGQDLLTVDSSDRIDPEYGATIGFVVHVPASAAGHRVQLVRTGGGRLGLDVVLPARPDPLKVILVKEPYVDWSASSVYTMGSDAVCDRFNGLIDEVAAEFANVVVVDPQGSGRWNRDTDLQTSGVGAGSHPNDVGSRHLREAVTERVPSI